MHFQFPYFVLAIHYNLKIILKIVVFEKYKVYTPNIMTVKYKHIIYNIYH